MAAEVDEFPDEVILFDILPRLPAKSVVRFMCVCKQWHAFLRTPMFKKLFVKEKEEKVFLLSNKTAESKFYTIDCEAPQHGVTACGAFPLDVHPLCIKAVTSFHGLVCVGILKYWEGNAYSDLILWNPLTREHKTLSKHRECYKMNGKALSLYYNSSEDDYRLLRVTYSDDIYVFSLKSDSWRKLGSIPRHEVPGGLVSDVWRPSTWLNEELYFLRVLVNRYECWSSPPVYLVLRFDTKTEKFTEMAIPPFKNYNYRHAYVWSFFVLRGCIHFGVAYHDTKRRLVEEIQLWRMDGDGVWTKAVTYNNIIPIFEPWYDVPLHMMRDGHWIMNFQIKPSLWQVDLEKDTKDMIMISSSDSMLAKGKYIETFVSPNQYMK